MQALAPNNGGKLSRHCFPALSTLLIRSLPSRRLQATVAIPSLPLPRSTMAAIDASENGSTTGLQEPSPKIPKLSHNGADQQQQDTHDHRPVLRVKKLSPNAIIPSRASPLAAGYDLSSAVEATVPARGKALVATDLSIAIPEGTYARIAPRSGLAWKRSIDVGAGVIDADYRGPVGIILFNHSDVEFAVKPGDRIAQMIIERIMTPEVVEADDLDGTARGAGGFGSTGV